MEEFVISPLESTRVVHSSWCNERRAAEIIGCSVSKLRQDRHKCRGLPYAKFGRSVRYCTADILPYMVRQRITPLQ